MRETDSKKPNIIGILTTKNRLQFFKKALASMQGQTRKPDKIIAVSDSDEETYLEEQKLSQEAGCTLIRCAHEHNLSGSLNTAVYHYVRRRMLGGGLFAQEFSETYVALLDDDDEWRLQYVECCEAALCENDADFIVCGLVYKNESGSRELAIPKTLSIDDFLTGNPHVQGSNTFIRLSVLLRAGLFDENIKAATDRDLFVRVMMQKPRYVIVNRHLVLVDAFDDRERITNSRAAKADGFQKFYYKYGGLMSGSVKEAFFRRAAQRFGIGEAEITQVVHKRFDVGERFSSESFDGVLVAGFIATQIDLGLRLLRQFVALKRVKLKVVILFNSAQDTAQYEDLLRENGIDFVIVKSADVTFDDYRDVFGLEHGGEAWQGENRGHRRRPQRLAKTALGELKRRRRGLDFGR